MYNSSIARKRVSICYKSRVKYHVRTACVLPDSRINIISSNIYFRRQLVLMTPECAGNWPGVATINV